MRSSAFFRAVSAVLLAVLAATALHAEEIRISHAQGETVLPRRPEKVLVYDLASLDTLHALGVPVAGVPGSNIPDHLAEYRGGDYLKIGTLFEPDYEAVAAAKPDLILIAGRSSPRYGELSRIAPTIDLTIAPDKFLKGARANAETLGRIFGKQAEVHEKLAALDASIARLREAAAGAGKAMVVMTNGGKVTAYGPGSRFGWIHDDLGFVPAVADVQSATHGEAVSFEFLAEANPDWLFVVDRDAAVGRADSAASKTLDNELVAETKAAKSGHIVYVDTARWYLVGGGLDALQVIVDQMASALAKSGG